MAMYKDLSERANSALEVALALSKEYGDSCCATGHLIYGLTSDHLSVGNRIFNDINIYPEMFRDHLKKLPRETVDGNGNGLHPLVKEAIARGRRARQRLGGGREMSTDHLLVALLSLRKGSAHECLREFSVEPDEICMEILEAMGFEMADMPEW